MMETNGLPIRNLRLLVSAALLMLVTGGCVSKSPKWIEQPWTPVDFETAKQIRDSDSNSLVRTSAKRAASKASPVASRIASSIESNPGTASIGQTGGQEIVRGQDPGYPMQQGQPGSYVPPTTTIGGGGQFLPAGTNQANQQYVQQQTYQLNRPAPLPVPNTGDPNQLPSYFDPVAPVGSYVPPNFANIDVLVREAQTGKMTFGAAYNSNSGLVGQIIIDEKNFDILGFPRSIQDISNGTAWRGRGQGFRMELVPGNEVQRYLVSFTEPYLFNSQVSFSASGYFFDRRYLDWDEQRLGGRVSFGYRLTPDLSLSVGLRMENVNIHDPRVGTSPSLNAAVGDNSLFLGQVSLINDTRDHPFMASEGSYLEMSFFQGFGDFSYPRGDVDYRRYFLVSQRPDGSGRHILSLGTKLGFSGSSTPVFENYHPGGFSTMRGFDFRGVSPLEGGVRVGGRFQWLNTLEYTFPITADDMFKGVLFCDFGTVEREIEINSDNFRVAPGFGFRVHMPVGGAGGAPLAFDFAFPISDAEGDDRQVFSFYMGVLR